jgi:16S rRNA (guanine(966)-N(2))-methyltransferase RsmD
MKQNLYTAISSGKYKGKKLLLPPLSSTRSTKSILKGSYFDTIQFDIVDSNFLELFGGSGSMGLEALSRGAKRAYFVEIDTLSYKILKDNCDLVDSKATTIYYGDSFKLYSSIIGQFRSDSYIYIDPPFNIRKDMEEIYDRCLELIKNTPKTYIKLLTIEHISSVKFPKTIGDFQLKQVKKFGKSSLSHYE